MEIRQYCNEVYIEIVYLSFAELCYEMINQSSPLEEKKEKHEKEKKTVAKMAKAPRRFYVIMNIGKIFTIQIM